MESMARPVIVHILQNTKHKTVKALTGFNFG